MTGALYTVPTGAPFLKSLARGLLDRHGDAGDPFALAKVTVFLPTRRAVRALQEILVEEASLRGRRALFLPRLSALGDASEEELVLFAQESAAELDIAPAVPALLRRVRLAELLMQGGAMPLGDALSWAKSLADFLDEALIEEIDLRKIAAVVPDKLAQHYQASQALLGVLTDHWAELLSKEGYIEAAERRRLLMAAQAEAWSAGDDAPLYIAGSTGSIPATARLMRMALSRASGTLLLPGLDRELDEAAWAEVGETHPQYGLKRLLEFLEVKRETVADWPYTEGLARARPARVRLIAEALRPAPTTDSWALSLAGASFAEALEGMSLEIARDEAEEARIIALAMRAALETPTASAALVTPDRTLARRVVGELARWGIAVDDSAGTPLKQSPPAALMRLALEAVQEEFAPIPLLALLKHPLAHLGLDPAALGRAASRLERLALRGRRPEPGLAGLLMRIDAESKSAAERAEDEQTTKRIEERARESARLVARLEKAFAPLAEHRGAQPCAVWAQALARVAESIADGAPLWQGDAGEAAAAFLRELAALTLARDQTLADFTRLFDMALEDRVLRAQTFLHPRLFIWGPLEARLQSADLVILGGLNEGVWPARAEEGPWVNRLMRASLGLSQPERRIGLAAHDFQELAAAPRVLLTAAEKIDGAPALPSRWLMRLRNYLAGRKQGALLQGAPLGEWARAIDAPRASRRAERPAPNPPLELRPRRLSITEIKTLRRDPYAIYARHVLKLRPLDPVDQPILARDRGTIFHEILETFVRSYPERLPDDALGALFAIAARKLEALDAETRAFWQARIARAGAELVAWEKSERERARIVALEASGEISLALPLQPVQLRGRIDRIDQDRASGALTIIDYKTGRVPGVNEVKILLDPQLPLGALMAQRGALENVAPKASDRLVYLNVSGGSGVIDQRKFEEGIEALVAKAESELIKLLARYDEGAPYYSWAIAHSVKDVGDYDLLARRKEWQVESEDEE